MFHARHRWLTLLLAGILPTAATATATAATAAPAGPDPGELSLKQLEKRLPEIDAEITRLAHGSLRSGVGAIGYRSIAQVAADSMVWVRVDLDRTHDIDEIVLVPTLWRDSKAGFQADGFPEAFRIVAGTDLLDEGTVIASFNGADKLLPRTAPVIIPVRRTSAAWVRIEATRLSRRAFDGQPVFQLSELLVFSGPRNVALRRPVTASSQDQRGLSNAWDKRYLVDGHMPYLMDAARGGPSIAYIGSVSRHHALTIDLGAEYPLSEIHLHSVDQSDTVPQAYPGNLGVPPRLMIEGARTADFSDLTPLLDLDLHSIMETGPVMMWPLPESVCRYVRVVYPGGDSPQRFGFAEIEIYSGDTNVAAGRPIRAEGQSTGSSDNSRRFLSALTDGHNLYGRVLPIRIWMNQLAHRHDLETARPLVAAELNRRYESQKRNLRIMTWLAAVLAAGVAFTILADRMLRMRQADNMRKRFAADLHDELGANIHTIGLLCDLARDADTREEQVELLEQSRGFTERCGATIRNWSKRLEARGVCENLIEDMELSAASLLADIDHEFSIEGEEHLQNLKPRRRIYVYLFYKECLTNILRHSGATRVTTRLTAVPGKLTLVVSDNGIGLRGAQPDSLKRRARLLGTKVSCEDSTDGGTRITLKLNIRRLFPFHRAHPKPSKS